MPDACRGPEEGVKFSGTGIRDGYGPPCRCWELNLSSLKSRKDNATLKRTGWVLSTIRNKGSFEDTKISKAKQVATVIELYTQNGKCYSMYTVSK